MVDGTANRRFERLVRRFASMYRTRRHGGGAPLVDRGLLSYDEPLASYWPVFAADDRRHVTLRMLLSHQAGLHRIRGLLPAAEDLLDHLNVTEVVAAQAPRRPRRGGTGYHALTFGWLVAGLVQQVTGHGLREAVEIELAKPLDLDGLEDRRAAG